MELIQIKSYFNNEIRRFDLNLPDLGKYEYLVQQLRTAYEPLITDKDQLKLYWLDDENESVGFSTDPELEYAVRFFKKNSEDKCLLKLNIQTTHSRKMAKSQPKNIQKTSSPPVKSEVCAGCDQVLQDNKFKSYICPNINICQKCDTQSLEPELLKSPTTSNSKKAPNSHAMKQISEMGKKNWEILTKKISKDFPNVKVLLPGYKFSDLSKTDEVTEDQMGKSSQDLNEGAFPSQDEVNKLEEVNKMISTGLGELETIQDEAEEKEQVFDEILKEEKEDLGVSSKGLNEVETPEKELEEEMPTIEMSDDIIIDCLGKLRIMGLEDDEDGCLRELIREKKADVNLVVESYFDLCFQRIKQKPT